MKRSRAALYAAAFAGLAATTAVVIGSIATPTVAALLLWAAAVATLAGVRASFAGGPGRPPSSCSPSARICWLAPRWPVPADVHGAGGQLAFYVEQLGSGGKTYALDVFPLEVADKADMRLLLSLVMYAAIWLAAFLALSLRKPLPAIVVLLMLLGFGSTTARPRENVWATLAFLLLAGSMLVLVALPATRALEVDGRRGGRRSPPSIAAALALSIVGATRSRRAGPCATGAPGASWGSAARTSDSTGR